MSDGQAGGSDARCLFYIEPGRAEICNVRRELSPTGGDPVAMRALWTGVSRGTERLVFSGAVPKSEYERMRAPFQHGAFPFPVGYGYSWVGTTDERHAGASQTAFFALLPHQDRVIVERAALIALPAGLPPRRAVLAANMETALNCVWDAGLGPGDRLAIVGGGVLGLLVAGLAAAMPGTDVTVVDIDARRRAAAEKMGAVFALPGEAGGEADIVIHASASEAGLAVALDLAGLEGVVVEASWHGASSPRVPLGGAFHSRRLTLKSSQVGMVSPSRRPRFDHRRRLAMALRLLTDAKYDALITREVAFADLPDALPSILEKDADGLATAVSYL